MEDWDLDQRRGTTATRPVRPAGVLLVVVLLVLLAVGAGVMLRGSRPASPYAAPAETGAAKPEPVGGDPAVDVEQDAALNQAGEMLLGGGALSAGDPNSLHLSPGQTAVLRNKNDEVRVTPGRITAGTGACATGPLLTVAVSVRVTRGSADLTLGDFTLRGTDGSVARAIEACSSGFAEAAGDRTVVFASAQLGRLAYGPDPEQPVAMWQLT
jgi:hypothetical protein